MRVGGLFIRNVAAFLAALAVAPCATAALPELVQLPGWLHTSWTGREGAPTTVNELAQTEDGFLWLATPKGLIRFDGVRFEAYVPSSGAQMRKGEVRTLLALPGNALMIGWHLGGAALLRDGHLTQWSEAEGLPPGSVVTCALAKDGVIWCGTTSRLARFDGSRWHAVDESWGIPPGTVDNIFVHSDGTLAIVMDSTIHLLPEGATRFHPVATPEKSIRFAQAPDGTLYVARLSGTFIVDSLKSAHRDQARPVGRHTPVDRGANSHPRFIHADRRGGLWNAVARDGQFGLEYVADPLRKSTNKDDAFAMHWRSFIEDAEGDIWIGTDQGLHRLRRPGFKSIGGEPQALPGALLLDADGGRWFGQYQGPAGSYLRKIDAGGNVRVDRRVLVSCAYRDHRGTAWFGALQGSAVLLRFNDGRLEDIPVPVTAGFEVQSIAVDRDDGLWVSVVRQGVLRRLNGRWAHPPGLPGAGKQPAFFLFADSTGRVWASYPGGRIVEWKDGAVIEHAQANGPGIGEVFAITEIGGRLLFGGDGLALFEGGRFRRLAFADAEPMAAISGIVQADDGDLWLSGTSGVIRVRATEFRRAIADPSHAMVHRLFDADDGITGITVNMRPLPGIAKGPDGRIWVPTSRDLFHAAPKDMAGSGPLRIAITSITANHRRQTLPAAVNLEPNTNSLQIDYTTPSLAMPKHVRFRYQLDGVDRDWQEAGTRRQAFYTNLGPGTYTFRVIATNEEGIWSPVAKTQVFSIAPAFHQTSWFKALCAMAVLLAAWLAYWLRLRKMRREIQGRLEERLFERERIARELHDTLMQGFQGLVLKMQGIMQHAQESRIRDEIEGVLKHADTVLAEGRDRVRDLRESVNLREDLTAALSRTAEELSHMAPAEFAMQVDGEARVMHPVVLDEAYRIAREALCNAYLHSGAKRVESRISYGRSEFRVQVRDDGKGIAASILEAGGLPGHWGLAGMEERARRLGGKLRIVSNLGAGTEVELEVPAKAAYK